MKSNIDFCQNSVFLNKAQKNFINQNLEPFLTKVTHVAADCPIPVNIYFGGSLALREPALRVVNAKPVGLMSDADMFVFCKNMEDIPRLYGFKNDLKKIVATGIEYSFHFFPLASLQLKHSSLAALSLWESRDQPIWQSFDLPEIEQPKSSPELFLNLFVGRTMRHLLSVNISTHAGDVPVMPMHDLQKKYGFLKFLIAGLQVFNSESGGIRISDSVSTAQRGDFGDLLTTEQILDIARQREIYDAALPAPVVDLHAFISKVVAKYTQITGNDLLSVSEKKASGVPTTIIDLIQGFLLSYALYKLSNSDKERNLACALLNNLHQRTRQLSTNDPLNELVCSMQLLRQDRQDIQSASFMPLLEKLAFLNMQYVTNSAMPDHGQ